VLARLGAAGLLGALPIPLLAAGFERWNVFAVVPPFEAVAASLALWWLARAASRGQVSASIAAGVLLPIGALLAVGSIGLVKFSGQRIGAVAVLLSVVVLLGALAAALSGAECLRTAPRAMGTVPVDPAALIVVLAASGLLGVALFAKYDGQSSLWSEVGEGASAEFFFEPALALALVFVAALALASRQRFASALLITVGLQVALHHGGVLIAAWRAVGEVGEVRAAGFIGVAGGVLAALAGWYVHRSLAPSGPAVARPR
jgi:hypothetical protein